MNLETSGQSIGKHSPASVWRFEIRSEDEHFAGRSNPPRDAVAFDVGDIAANTEAEKAIFGDHFHFISKPKPPPT